MKGVEKTALLGIVRGERCIMTPTTAKANSIVIGPPCEDEEFNSRVCAQFEKYDRNRAWFQAHATEIGITHQGRYICVAAAELFVGDEPKVLYERVRKAHPSEWGSFFVKYIPVRTGSNHEV
jgi:hypothetical protein